MKSDWLETQKCRHCKTILCGGEDFKTKITHLENQLEIARGFMDFVAIHYNHPMHDHNWAYYVFEKAKAAHNAIEKLENKP